MTHSEALAAVAQGVINIAEGVNVIEKGSRVYNGMAALVNDPAVVNAPELLASLTELVNSPNAKQNAIWDRARAAIAKATGN